MGPDPYPAERARVQICLASTVPIDSFVASRALHPGLSGLFRLHGHGDTVSSEGHRVEEAGGWIEDGRVCDILAVSRAFGDREFKGDGLPVLLRKGVE